MTMEASILKDILTVKLKWKGKKMKMELEKVIGFHSVRKAINKVNAAIRKERNMELASFTIQMDNLVIKESTIWIKELVHGNSLMQLEH
jgi:hypothetical protein